LKEQLKCKEKELALVIKQRHQLKLALTDLQMEFQKFI
jgi:hypothetical protein